MLKRLPHIPMNGRITIDFPFSFRPKKFAFSVKMKTDAPGVRELLLLRPYIEEDSFLSLRLINKKYDGPNRS